MNQKILVIEDEAPLRSLLAKLLSDEGFDLTQAGDGVEGLEMALKDHPDLIVLDVLMPKKDGISMLEELRADEWGKQVKVIMLTNADDVERQAQAVQHGVDSYLLKWNWKLNDFVNLVKTKLE
jgi:DNA-binding response OmpR family regulator